MSWNLALQFNKFASITRVSGSDILIYNATGTKLASYKTSGLFLGDADAGGSSAGANNLVLPSYGSLTWGGITATPPNIVSGGGTSLYFRGASHNFQNYLGTTKAPINFAISTNINPDGTNALVLTSSSGVYQINNNNTSTPTQYYLPDALTTPVGTTFTFNNNSTGSLQLKNFLTGTVLYTATAGSNFEVIQLTNATQDGTWDIHASLPSTVVWGTSGATFNGNMTITGATRKLSVQGTHLWSGAGSLSGNLVLGSSTTGDSITTGTINTIVGSGAGATLTSGIGNTAFGAGALASVLSGTNTTAIGRDALGNFTSGDANTAVGYRAGRLLTSGTNNVLIGQDAGYNLTTQGSNVLIGVSAGYYLQTATATGNVVVGHNTQLTTNATLNNTYIGSNITGGASVAGEIVIGSGATGLGTNTGQFGNSFTGVIRRGNGATTTWDIVSDMRIKENIVYLQDGLSKILLLKPARFDYKTIDEKNYVGFIAQDYEQVFPEQIKLTEPVGKEAELVDDKVKNISSNLNPYFVLAIQEQHAKITSLEAQLASLKATVDALVASTGHLVV